MLRKGLLLAGLTAVFALAGCNKNATAPEENKTTDLSDAEQMMLISTEMSQTTGGLMADLEMVGQAASGDLSALPKSAGFDTTITKSWITYSLSLSYFTANGVEQRAFIIGITDSVVYQSTLTGSFSDNKNVLSIDLNSGSTLSAADIRSGVIRINGTGRNNSSYAINTNNTSIQVKAGSTYQAKDVTVDLKSSTFVPTSGVVEVTIKGVFSKTGGQVQGEKAYSFTFTIEFTGSNNVKVTLPSGKEYTLNLLTGVYR